MNAQPVRPAAVAGMFYPKDPQTLADQVDGFLAAAPARRPGAAAPPAILVPHAGYIYSGATAGLGYALWQGAPIRHVVVLGPTHRVGIKAVALPEADRLATPLGEVPVWAEGVAAIADMTQVSISAPVHAQEHSIEVQLPFLQRTLDDFDVLSLAVGWVSPDDVAAVLERLWGTRRLGVVISSDLSHYHPYDQARDIDQASLAQVLNLDASIDHDQACGATGLDAMLLVAKRHHLAPRLLGACNSGDTAGDKDQVVGYASVAFETDVGPVLTGLARAAIAKRLGMPATSWRALVAPPLVGGWLDEPAATFVTLTQHGELRGCIGSLQAWRPLREDVTNNALAAAFDDPRFPPLRGTELAVTHIEVSVLSQPLPMLFASRDEALAQLRPGVDGVILTDGAARATFLPQVWDELPDKEQFIAHLLRKAGLPTNHWSDTLRLARYTVAAYDEDDSPTAPDAA